MWNFTLYSTHSLVLWGIWPHSFWPPSFGLHFVCVYTTFSTTEENISQVIFLTVCFMLYFKVLMFVTYIQARPSSQPESIKIHGVKFGDRSVPATWKLQLMTFLSVKLWWNSCCTFTPMWWCMILHKDFLIQTMSFLKMWNDKTSQQVMLLLCVKTYVTSTQ